MESRYLGSRNGRANARTPVATLGVLLEGTWKAAGQAGGASRPGGVLAPASQ